MSGQQRPPSPWTRLFQTIAVFALVYVILISCETLKRYAGH